MRKKISKLTAKHLLKDYFAMKKKLGRRPTCHEFMVQHNMRRLINAFGRPAWSLLLIAAGERARVSVPEKEQAVKDYLQLKKALGRKPKAAEYAKRCHTIATLRKVFGEYPWDSLLMDAGEKPRSAHFVTKEMLVQEYLHLKKKLGRQPFRTEYHKNCHGYGILNKILGRAGWEQLQKAAGDEPRVIEILTVKHLISDFLDLQEKLGRRPKLLEYTYQCHTPKVLDRVFGKPGWKNLLAAVGKKALPPDDLLTAEHVIEDYRETCRALKRRATQEEFRRRHGHTAKVFVRLFGRPGFSKLVKAAS